MIRPLSDDGVKFIEKMEGLRLVAYKDGGGVPTLGYGHTKDIKMGDTCTQQQAEAWLRTDVQIACRNVSLQIMDVNRFSDGQYTALVSFTFNCGGGSLSISTLRKLLNSGNDVAAAEEFPKWDNVRIGGALTPSKGLLTRRLAEQQLFLSGMGKNLDISAASAGN